VFSEDVFGAGEVLVFNGGDFGADIDPGEQGAADAFAVALDIRGAGVALAFGISKEAAFAGMRCHFV